MTHRIFVEQHPNKNYRSFHFSWLLHKPWEKYAEDADKKKPLLRKRIEKAFEQMVEVQGEGISEPHISSKKISISRNQAFEWDEVIKAVVEAFEKIYKVKIEVKIGEREPWMDEKSKDEGW